MRIGGSREPPPIPLKATKPRDTVRSRAIAAKHQPPVSRHHPRQLQRAPGWRALLLWLLLALPGAQVWLAGHELSHQLHSDQSLRGWSSAPATGLGADLASTDNDAPPTGHLACAMCLAAGGLAHAMAATLPAPPAVTASTPSQPPAPGHSRWTPPAARHYAPRAPPMTA